MRVKNFDKIWCLVVRYKVVKLDDGVIKAKVFIRGGQVMYSDEKLAERASCREKMGRLKYNRLPDILRGDVAEVLRETNQLVSEILAGGLLADQPYELSQAEFLENWTKKINLDNTQIEYIHYILGDCTLRIIQGLTNLNLF